MLPIYFQMAPVKGIYQVRHGELRHQENPKGWQQGLMVMAPLMLIPQDLSLKGKHLSLVCLFGAFFSQLQHFFGHILAVGSPNQLSWITKQ